MNQLSATTPVTRYRVQSIDVLRGLVMVIMALDHVRDFFHRADSVGVDVGIDPTNLATTTPVLFFTRWITHYCAPVFVFLAGTSAFIMGQKKTKAQLSGFLIKRGVWLVLVELFIITLSWTFDPLYHIFILQVIWAIGISMILLGILVWFSPTVIFILGLLIVCGHNLLDYPSINKGLKGGFISDLLYFGMFSFYPLGSNRFIGIIYAFLPWTGIMMLGYYFGKLYMQGVDATWRRKILFRLGIGITVLFLLLRFINSYGDPVSWSQQTRGSVFTFLSFFNLNKYPPSLMFVCMTLGPAILFLALMERIQNKFTAVMNIYGRVPMFYYILHFYMIHTLVVIFFYLQGYGTDDIITPNSPFLFKPQTFGVPLWGVYLIWIFIVAVLYPLCKKYDRYKSVHAKEKWWLSYV
jgi:uncharacterized membrane protein